MSKTLKVQASTGRYDQRIDGKLVDDDEYKFCTWSAAFAVRRSDLEPVGMVCLTDEEKEGLSTI